MLAETYLEDHLCSGCGNPLWLTTDDETYFRGDHFVCRACEAQDIERITTESTAGEDRTALAGTKYHAFERPPPPDEATEEATD